MRRINGVLPLTVMLACSHVLSAQSTRVHKGFWISPSVGAAVTFFDPLFPDGIDSKTGAFLALRMGGTVNQQLLLGGEFSAWESGDGIFRGNLGFTAQYYPRPSGGLFVDGMAGIATRSVSYIGLLPDGGTVNVDETRNGLGLAFAVGYDVKLASNFYLTPRAQAGLQYLASHSSPSFVFGLGATWH